MARITRTDVLRGAEDLVITRQLSTIRSMSRSAARTEEISAASFTARLNAAANEIEHLLDRLLAGAPAPDEIARPKRLIEAMRYASLGGGKRLRPFLTIETAALFGVQREHALMAGAAIECIHCYSLVHDDLPSMDDDDLRRGRPTLHKAFDEATAILAGDGLLTFAFDILARAETHPAAAVRVALVAGLARAAGLGGMVGGQQMDLAAEGRFGAEEAPRDEQGVITLQAMKTGAILRFCCDAGAILGDAPRAKRDAITRYGRAVGQAFQIADDLLDVEGDTATLGKAAGKDAAHGKATLVDLLGPAGARQKLEDLVIEAEKALTPFGGDAAILKAAARFVAERRA
jgi:farnesyl diphosphate synthase